MMSAESSSQQGADSSQPPIRRKKPSEKSFFERFVAFFLWLHLQYYIYTGLYMLEPWERTIFTTILILLVSTGCYSTYNYIIPSIASQLGIISSPQTEVSGHHFLPNKLAKMGDEPETKDESLSTATTASKTEDLSASASVSSTQNPAGEKEKKKSSGAGKTVEVILKPVGDAPIMKQKKYNVDKTKTVAWVSTFVRKYLKLTAADSLFLYVNQTFAPSMDHSIQVLHNCFNADGKLVLHYSTTQAWG